MKCMTEGRRAEMFRTADTFGDMADGANPHEHTQNIVEEKGTIRQPFGFR